MRKSFIILFFFLFLIISTAPAADKSATPKLDAFLKLKTLSAEFTQDNYYPGLDNFTHKGKVYIMRPEKALWDYENPVEYFLLEPGKITHYSESLKQIIKMKIDGKNSSDPTGLLLSIFLDSSIVKEQFKVSEKGSTITLVPLSGLELENITIVMNGNIIEQINSKDISGNTVAIKFSKVKQDQSLDPSVFQKPLPEGIHIFEQ